MKFEFFFQRDFEVLDLMDKAIDLNVSQKLWLVSEKWIEARLTPK